MKYKIAFLYMTLFIHSLFGQSTQIEQAERLFQSEIFQAYRQQYNEKVSHLSPQLQIDEEDPKIFYQRLLTVLRSHKDLDPEVYRWFFLQVNVSDEQILNAKRRLDIQLDEKGHSNPQEIATLLNELYAKTLTYKEYNGYLHENEFYLDPILNGNFPYLLHCHHIAGKEVKFIRMPAPARTLCPIQLLQTIDDVTINEEFKTFLTLQAKEGKKHLYVNFLNNWKDSSNKLFNDKLVSLEQDTQFGKNFFIVTLDKDTDFYYQRNGFASLEDSKLFLETFLARLVSQNNGFRWSSHLDQKTWCEKCMSIVTDLHAKLFGKKKTLSIEERQTFIELSYSRIIRTLLEEIQPDSCNLTCHYAIDRGPSTSAIFLFDLLYNEQKRIPNQLALKLIALVVNQPILIHNRPAHSYRLERVVNALKYLE